jgi:hypothetical protein
MIDIDVCVIIVRRPWRTSSRCPNLSIVRRRLPRNTGRYGCVEPVSGPWETFFRQRRRKVEPENIGSIERVQYFSPLFYFGFQTLG